MIDVVDGGRHPDWVRKLSDDYSKVNALMGMDFNSTGSESIIAVKNGAPVGITMFDREPSFRISMIHAYPDHYDVIEPMLKSIIAMAIVQGKDSVTIHSADGKGMLHDRLREMEFKNAANCPCSLREGTVHMKLRF